MGSLFNGAKQEIGDKKPIGFMKLDFGKHGDFAVQEESLGDFANDYPLVRRRRKGTAVRERGYLYDNCQIGFSSPFVFVYEPLGIDNGWMVVKLL